jgi:hypothetical protein
MPIQTQNRISPAMQTQCNTTKLNLHPHFRRKLHAAFDAGRVSSDGGLLLLRHIAESTAFMDLVADCFIDHRDQRYVEHTVKDLVAQRIYAIAAGYEDLNDHDTLRNDPLLSLAVGKRRLFGDDRRKGRDRDAALACPATLNRIESAPESLNPKRPDLKIIHDTSAIERLFIDLAADAHSTAPKEIILDIDATDDRIHGNQEGRFYHGYYKSYCFLPLYIFWGDHLLSAKLNTADRSATEGYIEELSRVVEHLRCRFPGIKVLIRGDGGFARDGLMTWCEAQDNIDYLFGIGRNNRLKTMVAARMDSVKAVVKQTCAATRQFQELRYRTKSSWSRERRVVCKVEALPSTRVEGEVKENSRFVVTSLPVKEWSAVALYEKLYCARGDMENRIKEQQLGMFADRTSAHGLRANQLRLWFSGLAYVLVDWLDRRFGLFEIGW